MEPRTGVGADPVELAQAVLANWRSGELAWCSGGFEIGLASWSELGERVLVELEDWLQVGAVPAGDSKHVFGCLQHGRVLFARVTGLGGQDDFGRVGGRFWAHAFVTSAPISQAFHGDSPMDWWSHLPFFATLEEAVAARTNERGCLPNLTWIPPTPRSPTSHSGLGAAVALAWGCAYGEARAGNRPIWHIPTGDTPNWYVAAEVYRAIEPMRWGVLGADTAFDGVRAEPRRRTYWVVGSGTAEGGAACPRVEGADLDPVGRWVVASASSGRWATAVQGVPTARALYDAVVSGAPEPGWTSRAPAGFLEELRPELQAAVRRELMASGVSPGEANAAVEGLSTMEVGELGEVWAREAETGQAGALALCGLLALGGAAPGVAERLRLEGELSPICTMWVHIALHAAKRRRSVPPSFPEALAELPPDLHLRWVRWAVSMAGPCAPELVVPALGTGDGTEWERRVRVSWQATREGVVTEELAALRRRWIAHLSKLRSRPADRLVALLQEEAADQVPEVRGVRRLLGRATQLLPTSGRRRPSRSANDSRSEEG